MLNYKIVFGVIIILLILYKLINKQSGARIYWFYKDSCSFCKKMLPEWKKFKSTRNNVVDIDVSTEAGRKMMDNFSLDTVPAIVKVKHDMRYVYCGDRTAVAIKKWDKSI